MGSEDSEMMFSLAYFAGKTAPDWFETEFLRVEAAQKVEFTMRQSEWEMEKNKGVGGV